VCDQPGVTLVTEHPALSVWNTPNQFFTTQEFVESEEQHIDLTGEGWWVVVRLGGRPIELWPVRPDRMLPVPHPQKFLSGYVYLGPDGERVPLGLDEVIQIRVPNPTDPYRGMGAVQSILIDLDSSRLSAEWNRNFFLNGAEPGGIIEVPTELGDDEFERLRMRWNEQHKGVANAHRVAILEMGKWVDRKFTQRDMQFAELRSVSREVIREAFAIHGHKLGLSESVNRANADAADVTYAKDQTIPRLGRFKQALNKDFLRLFGDMGKGYEFAHANPVPDDAESLNAERDSKTAAYKTLVDAGVEPEDAAAVVGLPPMRHTAPAAPAPVPVGAGAGQPGASWRPRV
jgi:HK97 family phage portal protein